MAVRAKGNEDPSFRPSGLSDRRVDAVSAPQQEGFALYSDTLNLFT